MSTPVFAMHGRRLFYKPEPVNRKFILNIIFLIAINLLIKPFWFFGIEVAVQNRLGNELYGLYASLLSFSILFNIFLDLGVTNFNNRELARHNHLLTKYLSSIIGIKLIFAGIYAVLCIIIGIIAGYETKQISILSFLILNQVLSSLILYLRSNINALMKFITDSILSVLDKLLMIIILSILLWGINSPFKLEWFIWSQTAAYFITATIAVIIVFNNTISFKLRFNYHHMLVIIKKSLPFSLLVLLMAFYNRMEPILLERLLVNGKEQAGLYAQGFRILEVFSNFALLFTVILLPIFSKMLKEKEDTSKLASLAFSILMIPVIVVALTGYAYRSELMTLMYHQPGNSNIFGIIIIGFIGISLTYIYGTLLTAAGKLKELNIMAVTAVVMNISLNLILIPRFEAQGAAIASCTTQILTGIVQTIMAVRILKLRKDKNVVLRFVFWLFSFIITLFLARTFVSNWLLAGLLSISLAFLFAFIFKAVHIKEIIKMAVTKES